MNGVINKRSGSMYCKGLSNPAQVVGNRSIREEVETGKFILRFLIWLINKIKEGGTPDYIANVMPSLAQKIFILLSSEQ